MKKFLAVLAFVFPLSANAQTIDFAVEAVDFFSDIHRVLEHPTFDGLTSDRRTIQLTA